LKLYKNHDPNVTLRVKNYVTPSFVALLRLTIMVNPAFLSLANDVKLKKNTCRKIIVTVLNETRDCGFGCVRPQHLVENSLTGTNSSLTIYLFDPKNTTMAES